MMHSEPEPIRLERAAALPPGASQMFPAGDRQIAVFNVDGTFHAIDNRCPHRAAPLQRGRLSGTVLTCPLHGWQFDVTTGEGVGEHGTSVTRYAVARDGHDLLLTLPDPELNPNRSQQDGICRYLVRYGALGWVARFGSLERIACSYGDAVLVQTDRGQEVGEVLAVPGPDGLLAGESTAHKPTGELLRVLTVEERDAVAARQSELLEFFAECQNVLSDRRLPVEVIDCERLFDENTIVLYYLGEPSEELGPLAVELGRDRTEKIIFQPVIDPPLSSPGGCGTGGCGCGR